MNETMVGKYCRINFIDDANFIITGEKEHTVTVCAPRPLNYKFDVKIEVAKNLIKMVDAKKRFSKCII